jgi:hypothetical protein
VHNKFVHSSSTCMHTKTRHETTSATHCTGRP